MNNASTAFLIIQSLILPASSASVDAAPVAFPPDAFAFRRSSLLADDNNRPEGETIFFHLINNHPAIFISYP